MEPLSETRPTTTISPPLYILEVAPPSYAIDIDCGLPSATSQDDLPVYKAENATEPKTLARGCWIWGHAFPLLWIIGMAM